MKKALRANSHSLSGFARKFPLTRARGRSIALLVIAFMAVALAVTTMSSAKSQTKSSSGSATNTSPQVLSLAGLAKTPAAQSQVEQKEDQRKVASETTERKPKELKMVRARSFDGDLSKLPYSPPVHQERPEREPPEIIPTVYGIVAGVSKPVATVGSRTPIGGPNAPMPGTIANFDGLDFATFGAGHPPDTNGDVGPTYYIQTVNTSIGIYNKSTGVRTAAFTFNAFMSQGAFGNLCDTNNFGDPVVLYDSFEDRWIISDFAFTLDGSGNVINPPGAFQCIAASKTGDPVSGGWNFYSINTTGGLGDYPKLGIWPDGLYMSVNMFDYAAGGSFQNARAYAFNKAQMYAGDPTVQSVSFDAPSAEFTLLPSNARLQAGTPPAGSPNYFSVVWQFLNAISVYKFHVDWNSISTSTFTGPFITVAPTSWASPPSTVPSQGGNNLDTVAPRLMMQNQYTNLGGVESLWNNHTVQGSSAAQSAVRYYQVDVTGGTVAANTTQAAMHNPDTTNRFMASLAVDRAGDMALGYSTSSSTSFPAIKYAGRLSTDPLNSLPQTEVSLKDGTGTQTGSCGSGLCIRWGDYSAMTLDPDGCTFWYTNEYYAVNGLNDLTRIGSLKFPNCTIVTSGTVQGTVKAAVGGTPISFATVSLGSRTTSTNGSGFYQFTGIPSGMYPTITASVRGYISSTVNNLVVTDGATTTQDFSLASAPTSGCLTDSTQADFQTGVPTNVDLITSSGNVILATPTNLDQVNTSLTTSGSALNSTTWWGQTFTAGVTGTLERADINLFCSTCTGTAPNLTLSVRATSGGLPTGADIASTTLSGNASGGASYFSGTFSSPPSLTAGTVYSLIVRPVADPSAGTYAATFSGSNVYAGGRRVTSTDSGSTWSAPNPSRDLGFHTYMKAGFAPSGDQVSSLKDANPGMSSLANWTTLSWNATTPANTTLWFQAAGSLVPSGPFNFVGLDGTAATFFTTSGSSLSQFNGLRYLKYKAFLSTTNTAVTPTLNDVTVCFTDVANPTEVKLSHFNAASFSDGVQLNWESGFEVNNLGYHLYREQQGKRTRVTPLAIAGSALTVGPGARLSAGYSYSWFDPKGTPDTLYYLEAIDLNGERATVGPIYPYGGSSRFVSPRNARAVLLNEIRASSMATSPTNPGLPNVAEWPSAMKASARSETIKVNPTTLTVQQAIAAGKAVKIQVRQNGWYRLTQPELVAAGLDSPSDARMLQLYVDGEEVPITLSSSGPKFNAADTLEFYGVGLDTPTTDTRTYWLINGSSAGKRVSASRGKVKPGDQGSVRSFALTTERREKLLYFSNLLNGDAENFFGAPVLNEPVDQTLTVRNVDLTSSARPQLEVALQGLTAGDHEVQLQLNGADVGTVTFAGRDHPVQDFSISRELLREGDNILSLVAVGGESDISLIDFVRVTYAHQYRADNNALRFSVPGGQTVLVNGFANSNVRVIDITNPNSPIEVISPVGTSGAGFAVTVPAVSGDVRTLIAFTDDLSGHPASIAANKPSSWNSIQDGADIVVITHSDFRLAIEPLASLRRDERFSVAVVDVEDIYDEFSYGAHTPAALKAFLSLATSRWNRKPQYLLLVGDSSWDPRNYLNQGEGDFVPTKLIDTGYLETASDDWLVDFNDSGLPSMAVGRLPARTSGEVSLMVSKIMSYEQERESNLPLRGAVMVADNGFEAESSQTRGLLPPNVAVETINRTEVANDDVTRGLIVDALDVGPMIVNYYGHGSVRVWTGAGLLDSDLAGNLTNTNRPPLYVMMTCLNGYTHDAFVDSLAEAVLKAHNGGAVAVWASSGFTESQPQFEMNSEFYRLLFGDQSLRLGEAARRAKGAISDQDVRRTWMLFGDPAMRMR